MKSHDCGVAWFVRCRACSWRKRRAEARALLLKVGTSYTGPFHFTRHRPAVSILMPTPINASSQRPMLALNPSFRTNADHALCTGHRCASQVLEQALGRLENIGVALAEERSLNSARRRSLSLGQSQSHGEEGRGAAANASGASVGAARAISSSNSNNSDSNSDSDGDGNSDHSNADDEGMGMGMGVSMAPSPLEPAPRTMLVDGSEDAEHSNSGNVRDSSDVGNGSGDGHAVGVAESEGGNNSGSSSGGTVSSREGGDAPPRSVPMADVGAGAAEATSASAAEVNVGVNVSASAAPGVGASRVASTVVAPVADGESGDMQQHQHQRSQGGHGHGHGHGLEMARIFR